MKSLLVLLVSLICLSGCGTCPVEPHLKNRFGRTGLSGPPVSYVTASVHTGTLRGQLFIFLSPDRRQERKFTCVLPAAGTTAIYYRRTATDSTALPTTRTFDHQWNPELNDGVAEPWPVSWVVVDANWTIEMWGYQTGTVFSGRALIYTGTDTLDGYWDTVDHSGDQPHIPGGHVEITTFDDINGDGIRNTTEPDYESTIGGNTFILTPGGVTLVDSTGVAALYAQAGSYSIAIGPPAGYTLTTGVNPITGTMTDYGSAVYEVGIRTTQFPQ